MRALVTGGSGFIGAHVARQLLAAGHHVRVLCLAGEDLSNLDGLAVEQVPGDVTDRHSLDAAMRGRSHVFHLAALYVLWHRHPDRIRAVNVEGTRQVLEAAAQAGVGIVVHTSSLAVFAGQGPDTACDEDSPFRLGETGDLYSQSKYEAHQVALDYARRGLDLRIAAPCVPIGPGDLRPTPTGALLLQAATAPVVFTLDSVANFVDVRDVAAGQLLIAADGARGRSYLLGHRNLSYAALIDLAMDAAGRRRPVVTVPPSPLGYVARGLVAGARLTGRPPILTPAVVGIAQRGLRADASRAVRELTVPQTPLPKALRDAFAWFRRRGYC